MAGQSNLEVNTPGPEGLALEWLLIQNVVTDQDVQQALALNSAAHKSTLITLNQMGVLTDTALAAAYSHVTGLEVANSVPPSEPSVPILNPPFMRETKSLLLAEDGPLYVVDPLDDRATRGTLFAIGHCPPARIILAGEWLRLFQNLFPTDAQAISQTHTDDELAAGIADQDRDAPIVRQVAAWLSEAADSGASDVHFDVRRNALEVYYRIDGVLKPVSIQPKAIAPSVVARIKVLANLDLGERNQSQDGRATVVVRGRKLDVRVSVVPTINGEAAVVRLLDRPDGLLSLSRLGFDQSLTKHLQSIVRQRHGLFIVAGPTGSGKTTTLYACLEMLKGSGLKILSVEDPVEYHFDHVSQVQISEKVGRNFASALRSFLRHDPDVILVGEIRDSETAQVAVQAALSGHLVLATIHAIDTARVRTRLIDMGVEPFRLDACLVGSLAQRLVRQLCPACRIQRELTAEEKEWFERSGAPVPIHAYDAVGCMACSQDGFKGRTVVASFALSDHGESSSISFAKQASEMISSGETTVSEIFGLLH